MRPGKEKYYWVNQQDVDVLVSQAPSTVLGTAWYVSSQITRICDLFYGVMKCSKEGINARKSWKQHEMNFTSPLIRLQDDFTYPLKV